MKFLSCGVCVFYKMGPQRHCRRSMSPSSSSLMGRRRHHCRSWVTVAIAIAHGLPSLVGHHHHHRQVAVTIAVTRGSLLLTGCHRLQVAVAHRSSSLAGHHCSRVTIARRSLSLTGRHRSRVAVAQRSLSLAGRHRHRRHLQVTVAVPIIIACGLRSSSLLLQLSRSESKMTHYMARS